MVTTLVGTQFSELAERMDELFVRQTSRFAFHHDDTQNEHRIQENRLSSLMLDKSVSNEKHLEYARAIIGLCDSYKRDFIGPLDDLTEEIQKLLLTFEQLLQTSGAQLGNHSSVQHWLSLSKDLYQARLMALESIKSQTEFEIYLPKLIIQNGGRSDFTLPPEQSEQFTDGLTRYAALMQVSHEDNQRIQQEREPLTKLLFFPTVQVGPASSASRVPSPVKIHPLEGKGWFRLLKVLYFAFWILGLGILAVFAYGANDFIVFVVGAVILAITLIVLKRIFYYVVLGRATATEKPGKGFLDLEELRTSVAVVQANNPDVYQEVVAPFFQMWKERYGRRVPLQEVEAMQRRIDYELNKLKDKRQEIVEKAARQGVTIDLATLRKKLDKSKAEYNGADRQAYIQQIDLFLTTLEVKYGTSIPVDEANKLLDKLDDDIRAHGADES